MNMIPFIEIEASEKNARKLFSVLNRVPPESIYIRWMRYIRADNERITFGMNMLKPIPENFFLEFEPLLKNEGFQQYIDFEVKRPGQLHPKAFAALEEMQKASTEKLNDPVWLKQFDSDTLSYLRQYHCIRVQNDENYKQIDFRSEKIIGITLTPDKASLVLNAWVHVEK